MKDNPPPATECMRPFRKPVPSESEGDRSLAGHLVTSRIQNLFPADGTQSFLVCATLGKKNTCELQLVALDLGGGGRTVAILRSVLCRSLFAIFTFRSVGLSTHERQRGIEQDQHKRDEALRSREVYKRKTYREPVLRSSC